MICKPKNEKINLKNRRRENSVDEDEIVADDEPVISLLLLSDNAGLLMKN